MPYAVFWRRKESVRCKAPNPWRLASFGYHRGGELRGNLFQSERAALAWCPTERSREWAVHEMDDEGNLVLDNPTDPVVS